MNPVNHAHPMEIDLEGEDQKHAYRLLAGVVIPRPIAWVTTMDREGRVNAAPFSFFNVLGVKPPIVGFSPGNKSEDVPKDTPRNIRATGEFVVNLVDEATAEAMYLTSADLPYGESEIDHAGLSVADSVTISVPRIAEAPVALECVEWATLEIVRNRLVIGLVKRMIVRDGIIDPETFRVNSDAYHPVGRMQSPSGYCRTGDLFDLPRPD